MYALSIPGRILGSIVCGLAFAIGGLVWGVLYPWFNETEQTHDVEDM